MRVGLARFGRRADIDEEFVVADGQIGRRCREECGPL